MTPRSVVTVSAAVMLTFAGLGPRSAYARKPSAPNGCAMLPIALLEKTFGDTFDPTPSETKSPPAYGGPWGSRCEFVSKPPFSKGHQTKVEFLVYVEASPAEAKQTFDKVAAFFADRSKGNPSVGESAYWGDTNGEPAIHVLKGKVHYSLSIEPANEAQLVDLARNLAALL